MPTHTRQILVTGAVSVVLLSLAAVAQPVTTAQFAGTAKIGPEARQVGIHFSCNMSRGKVNRLDAELDIPDAEHLQRVFDVDPFEGPTGIGGRMHLVATGSTSTAQVDLEAAGSFGNNGLPGTTFTFGAAATTESRFRASMQKLQAVVAVLSSGPARFTWVAENPAKGGPPIEVSAELSDTDAARFRVAVAPCKGR